MTDPLPPTDELRRLLYTPVLSELEAGASLRVAFARHGVS
jgi:hypothetical protein